MRKSFYKIGLTVACAALAGCASSPWSANRPAAERPTDAPPVAAPAPIPPGPPEPAAASAEPSGARAMQEVMAELQQLGALNPAARDELMADLKQIDPALWPGYLHQFRALAAYRRRAQQQGQAGGGDRLAAVFPTSGAAAPVRAVAHRQELPVPALVPPQQQAPQSGRRPIDQADRHVTSAQPGANMAAGCGPLDRLPATEDAALTPGSAPPGDYPCTPHPTVRASPGRDAAGARRQALPAGQVITATYDGTTEEDWQAHLATAIRSMESQLAGIPRTPGEITRHARLRMLYLLAGRREDALRPIPAIAPALQDFWSKELYGLATWLDTRRNPDAMRRAAEAKQILDEALSRLGQSAPLVVRNLAFCTKVQSYGSITRFDKYEFTPGQEVLLYAEVENFSPEPTPEGFHTALRSSYQIFDSRGQRVADHEFTTTEEYCQHQRRDFFIGYHLRLPKRIYPGKHTLQVTIEDLNSKKVGQSSVELAVKGEGG